LEQVIDIAVFDGTVSVPDGFLTASDGCLDCLKVLGSKGHFSASSGSRFALCVAVGWVPPAWRQVPGQAPGRPQMLGRAAGALLPMRPAQQARQINLL